jgi:hypothetical protein
MPIIDQRMDTLSALLNANTKRWPVAEAMEHILAVQKAVKNTGKKGKVTITFAVETDKQEEGVLAVSMDVTSTAPRADRKKALLYPCDDGLGFSKTDPKQLELLAEQEAERDEKARRLNEEGIAQIGRGVPATA